MKIVQETVEGLEKKIKEIQKWCADNHHDIDGRSERIEEILDLRSKIAVLKNRRNGYEKSYSFNN